MRAVSANLFALLFLCTCASVFYVWDTLENRLERHKRGFHLGSLRPGPPADLSTKTFRTLLAVPAAHRLHPGGGNSVGLEVHNLTNVRDQTDRYRMNVDNTGSTRGEDPVGSPVEEGIFWNKRLDDNLHVGFTEEHARAWRERARGHRVVKLEPGCGRISNQLATFSDGTRACVRYGINADQVLGETLTYYLASLLGITNVPPLVLAQLNADGDQWSSVRRRIGSLQWGERAVVSLTEWVSNLTGVVTPAPLRQQQQSSGGQISGGLVPQLVPQGVEPSAAGGLGGLHPLRDELRNKTAAELAELVQWSDLIVLDYLTANFDRLVSNLFSLQWDPRVMERDTNNLLRTPRGDLVFIDNEAGLVHGYRVLNMWEKYHSAVLGSVCVFRRRTAQRVAELHRRRDARTRLLDRYRDNEPLSSLLGFLSDEHAGVLQDRIDRLYKHILHCKGRFSQL